MRDADWVTWEEAAALAGVRMPTVEHAVRVGRIRRRPRRGQQPTLSRESVLEWATWRHRQQTNHRTLPPPVSAEEHLDPGVWTDTYTAASVLAVTTSTVRRLGRAGALETRRVGQKFWVSIRTLDEVAAERRRWVSRVEAARIIGCSSSTLGGLIDAGCLVTRRMDRAYPSIDRSSAEEYALVWAARKAERAARSRPRPMSAPPDDDAWLDSQTTGLLLGFSPSRVRQLAGRGSLPGMRRGRKWWFRRSDIEAVAAARAFRSTHGRPAASGLA